MALPKQVTITEVSPRDGLQNEKTIVSTETKIQFIALLTQAGFSSIETTAFVNPKKIPALADHSAVMQACHSHAQTTYSALIPNTQGLHSAIKSNCQSIAVITAISETFSQKNMNCSIDESLNRISDILNITQKNKISVRAYISCTLGCPYEGFISVKKTAQIAKKLTEMGCDTIVLADTIGTGTPQLAQALIKATLHDTPLAKLAIHFHDTYGQALANIYACLELGIHKIDSSVGGLGGCPYAKGASVNVATEDVLYLLNGLQIHTGIDLQAAIKASEFIHTQLSRETQSKVAKALKAKT